MIGKKINQLATELAPESTDLTIIGDPTTGVSKKITLAQLGAIFSGAVSFYTNLAAFPVTGDINVIYCAKDTKKLYLWTGSAYVEVFPSQALLDTYQLRSEKGNANGYASLDSQGKVPISQLPSSIMEYKGTWNASTNTPTLANGTGDTGDVYICNVAGTVNFGAGPITFAVGDYVIYSGTIWQRSSGAVGTVTSVAATITGDSVTISGSPVTTSGTLAFAFAGTGAQYIKGDGTLATFPTTIDQAKNLITEVYNSTGATLTKGTVVYINGGQGNLPTVTKALASGDSTSAQTYGIVQADITNNNNGFVVVAGRLADIDTSAFSVGTQLYLSSTTAGAYTSTKQYAPAHLVYIGIIVRSHPTQGIIEVKIQNGYELDELHNVAAQTPTNNDGLFWESATSLWKNKSIATVLGYTPANAATYVPYTGATANVDLGAFDLISRSAYIEGTASYQAGLLIKQRGLYNFVTGAYTQIVADSATDLNIVHNQANTTRRRYALSVAALQDGDTFQYLLPRANGTIALTSDLTGGTVTSVAALTIGTSGTDLSSTVANGTTTPVITLNVPTASATNRGALSSTDWTTFNNKQNALTNPVTGTGTTNYLPKFTGTSTIGNSLIQDDGTTVSITRTAGDLELSLWAGNTTNAGNSILGLYAGTGAGNLVPYGTIKVSPDAAGNTRAAKMVFGVRQSGGALLDALTINASGNLGLGVTPSAWSDFKVLEFANGVYLGTYTGGGQTMYLGANNYFNGTDYIYKVSAYATRYQQTSGAHQWFISTISGTAGNVASFTQAMTLNASGNLSIGNTNDTYKLDVSGTGRFTSTLRVTNSGTNTLIWAQGGNDASGQGKGNFRTSDQGGTNYFDFGRDNLSTGNFVLTSGGGSPLLSITTTGAATFSSSVTTGGNVFIPNGNYYYAKRNTSGDNINVLGFASGSDTLTIKGGTSGSAASIQFADTGGTIATFYNSNLGIGTTSPQRKLHVTSSMMLSSGSAAQEFLIGDDNVRYFSLQTPSGAANLQFNVYGGSNIMTMTSGGNVGIGTTSPAGLLEINGLTFINNTGDTTARFLLRNSTTGASAGGLDIRQIGVDASLNNASNGYLSLSTNNTERMRITNGGNVGIGTTSPTGLLEVKGGSIILNSTSAGNHVLSFALNGTEVGQIYHGSDNINIYAGTSNYLRFSAGASERMRITSGGNVEINTGSIKTGAPTNGTAQPWKLGDARSGSISTNSYIIVSVNGTTYSIPALNGLP